MEHHLLRCRHARLSGVLAMHSEALWVAREQTRPADVAELEEEHDDTLKPNTATTVWRASPPEAVDVLHHRIRLDACFFHAFLQHRRIVHTLTTREDLLAADEDIERV
jgi:hypothetical protein